MRLRSSLRNIRVFVLVLTGLKNEQYNIVMTNTPGRPPETGAPRDEKIEVRVTRDEKRKFVKLAKELGLTTSALARSAAALDESAVIGPGRRASSCAGASVSTISVRSFR